MLSRALAPSANVSDIARRAGIPKGTLFSWVEQAKVGSMSSQSKKKRGRPRKSSQRSPEEKLRLLTEAMLLIHRFLGNSQGLLLRYALENAQIIEQSQNASAHRDKAKWR